MLESKLSQGRNKNNLNYNFAEVSKDHAINLIKNKLEVYGYENGNYFLIESLEIAEHFTNYFIN